jgi:hypothetical protein
MIGRNRMNINTAGRSGLRKARNIQQNWKYWSEKTPEAGCGSIIQPPLDLI